MTKEQQAGRFRFPDLSAPEDQVKDYAKRYFAPFSSYRVNHLQRITKSLMYALGNQWIDLDRNNLVEGTRGYTFAEQTQDQEVILPRPVTNMIAPAIDVEFSTLSKRQWMPKIPTMHRDPRMAAAAKVAEDVLLDRLKALDWEDQRDMFILNLIKMGMAGFYSYWDEPFDELTWTAAEHPHRCEQCGAIYADKKVPKSFLIALDNGRMPALADAAEDEEQADLSGCAQCGGPLTEISLSEEESKGLDVFKRPLGENLPKGKTALELVTPFEYYPHNGGIGHTPETLKIHGIVKPRTLDWIEDRHPELINEIAPDDAMELMREHPLYGEWDFMGFNSAYDTGIYDNHAKVYDLIAEPTARYPKGRRIRLIGSQFKVARNDELIREVDTEDGPAKVALSMFTSAIWKSRDGEYWGKTLPDDIISVQNRLNGIDAQTIEARERMGSPNVMVPSDANLDGPHYRTGYGSGKFIFYDPSVIAPNQKPEVFGGITMPAGIYNERDRCEQAFTKIIGPADIEIGEAPRNITTTSGLQILGEQAERRRATRERGITTAFRKVWKHQLDMLWVLRVDTDSYEAELPDGSWEIKEFTGAALAGQTKIEIERQAYVDRSIIVRENAMEALRNGLYDISTPMARKRLLELMGLPTDVNEDTSLQIEHARRQWVDFADKGVIPVVDSSLDNPFIRSQVIGSFLLQDEGKRIADAAMWHKILPVIAGWEEEHQQMSMMDDQARAFYGGEPDPKVAAEAYAKAMIIYQDSVKQHQQIQATTIPGQPPMAPPQEPPPPQFLPKQPELRILSVWLNMIQKKGGLEQLVLADAVKEMQDPKEVTAKVQAYMRFRAVYEAYRIGAPQAPAPGSTPGGEVAPQLPTGPQAAPPTPQPGA